MENQIIFTKKIKSPFYGDNVKVYSNIVTLPYINKEFVFEVFNIIKKLHPNDVTNEDNIIELGFFEVFEYHKNTFMILYNFNREEDNKPKQILYNPVEDWFVFNNCSFDYTEGFYHTEESNE